MKYHRVTLLVPQSSDEDSPAQWDWDSLLDSCMPVVLVEDVSPVEKIEARQLLTDAGYADYAEDVE